MHEANATPSDDMDVRPEISIALGVWVVFTAAVILLAEWLGSIPLPLSALVVIPLCVPIGFGLGRVMTSRRPRPRAGARIGIAIVIVGQVLDVVLVVAFGGYPGAGSAEASATVVTLLMGGYAAALAGAVLSDIRQHR